MRGTTCLSILMNNNGAQSVPLITILEKYLLNSTVSKTNSTAIETFFNMPVISYKKLNSKR